MVIRAFVNKGSLNMKPSLLSCFSLWFPWFLVRQNSEPDRGVPPPRTLSTELAKFPSENVEIPLTFSCDVLLCDLGLWSSASDH